MSKLTPIIERKLDPSGARQELPGNTSRFGYIKKLEIGGHAIPVGIEEAFDPKENKCNVKAVVLLTAFAWDGSRDTPMQLVGQIQEKSREKLDGVLKGQLKKHEAKFDFEIFHHSAKPGSEGYFPFIWSEKTCKGSLSAPSGSLSLRVADSDEGHAGWYDFDLTVHPEQNAQHAITIQSAPSVKKTVHWGNK